MIRCRTNITDDMIKALSKYHTNHKKNNKRNRIITIAWSIFLLLISLINAYGSWLKYHDNEPLVFILIRSSPFVIISLFVLYMSFNNHLKINRELKRYFIQTNTKFIDYIIDENKIQLIINNNSSTYDWNVIDNIESDDTFYYFSSNGKHSIIEKKSISPDNILRLEKLFNEKIHKQFL